jgi:DNA-binding XRE family transcriptional regulator
MKNLKKARQKAGLTQKQAAEAVGIAESAYQNYENNRRTPNVIYAIKISNVIGISVNYLWENSDL